LQRKRNIFRGNRVTRVKLQIFLQEETDGRTVIHGFPALRDSRGEPREIAGITIYQAIVEITGNIYIRISERKMRINAHYVRQILNDYDHVVRYLCLRQTNHSWEKIYTQQYSSEC